jgi:excinuclease ABC subunit A
MPWESDGRRWHTRDRVGRKGEPCRWDGRILERVVDRIQEMGRFGETNWNARSVVEIAAKKKSEGWFLHAITGEAWLLKLKFRTSRRVFQQQELVQRLGLKTLNQMDDVPVYGNRPRVRCKNLRGPWQEVEVRVYTLEEIDTPEFWTLVDEAAEGFFKLTTSTNPEDAMPWKKLGQKWHLMRKGFPPRKRVHWKMEVLEQLCDLLSEAEPEGQFHWTNQQVVHFTVPQRSEPWASLHTKRPGSLDLTLIGPKNRVGFGRVTELAWDREFDASKEDVDLIRLKFRTLDDLRRGDLADFLREHLETMQG